MNTVILDGIKFRKDSKSGYYLSSKSIKDGKRVRLHRYVWSKKHGEIPMGYQIHHIDHNKDNNELSNLRLMTEHEHLKLEAEYRKETNPEWLKKFHEKGIKKAPKWHASKDGNAWHSKHYNEMKDIWMKKVNLICEVCGKEYVTNHASRKNSRFCSNKCKSQYRRNMGLDNVLRKCVICGKEFSTNKYGKAKTCSKECRTRFRNNKS
ncbi:HNH endonuclease signature motif containing protein [Apilactobacillus kunkeei]|uniref:HNH endonuclease signature motif containing protein n=1 Tax=Apilactobacillus kunkeei TaxID=148814 RepID=UPI0006B25682|nr:HNH endonuclease signature motif containing protein [Apilactobacillus kunkeei]KOY69443.1 Uncharacterized protein RZ73_08250 [Apilactobacillus kunkeei]CAI2684065.1 hypothetical protein AKUFHON2_09170 [Apilactobacillus kunkeei]